MKKQIFLISMLVIFAAEIAALAAFVSDDSDFLRDAVKMNEAVHSVQEDWDRMETQNLIIQSLIRTESLCFARGGA